MALARTQYRIPVPLSSKEASSPKKLRSTEDRYKRSQEMIQGLVRDLSEARNEAVVTKEQLRKQNKALGFASASKKIQDLKDPAKAVRCLCMT